MNNNLYETLFIARQDLTPQQVENFSNDLLAKMKGMGGELSKTEFCGLRPLAYPIKKNKRGHYVLLQYMAPAAAVAEMERVMRINEDILRYMTIVIEEFDEGASALLQQRMDARSRGFEREELRDEATEELEA